MTPEGQVKKKIKEVFKRFGVHYTMPIGGPYAKKGKPDFVCCYYGKYMAIEAKALGKTQTIHQEKEQEDTHKAGGIYLVVRSENLYVLETLLQRIKDAQPTN